MSACSQLTEDFFALLFVWRPSAVPRANAGAPAYQRLFAQQGLTPEQQSMNWRAQVADAVAELQQYKSGCWIASQVRRWFRPKQITITNCSPTVLCIRPDPATDGFIINLPSQPFQLCAAGADPEHEWIDSSPFVILGHELLHLIHATRRMASGVPQQRLWGSGPTDSTGAVASEEVQTIGRTTYAQGFDGQDDERHEAVENDLRHEAGTPLRASHETIALCTGYEQRGCALWEMHAHDACAVLSHADHELARELKSRPSQQSVGGCNCDLTAPGTLVFQT